MKGIEGCGIFMSMKIHLYEYLLLKNKKLKKRVSNHFLKKNLYVTSCGCCAFLIQSSLSIQKITLHSGFSVI